MFEAAAREFGVSLEVVFPKPRSVFSAKEPLQAFVEQYAEEFTPPRGNVRELKVTQDAMPFEYAVVAPLFGRPGALRIDAFQITASIDGGRSERDAQLIAECLLQVIKIAAPPAGSMFRVSAYVHGTFSDPAAFGRLFNHTFEGAAFEDFGVHGSVRVENWPFPISILREPSKKLERGTGVFVRWETEFDPAGQVDDLRAAFAAAGQALHLDISTLAEP